MDEDKKDKEGVVLLVDDEEYVLKALDRSLRRGPFRVITCLDPVKAMDIVEDEDVDVIISDHRMPQMEGLDLLVRIRKTHPEIVRILLTGYADMEVAISAINEGKLFRFITKPWDDAELKELVIKALQSARLKRRSSKTIEELKKQDEYQSALEKRHPGIGKIKRDATGAIIIEE